MFLVIVENYLFYKLSNAASLLKKLFKLLDSTEEIANIRTLRNEDQAWYELN